MNARTVSLPLALAALLQLAACSGGSRPDPGNDGGESSGGAGDAGQAGSSSGGTGGEATSAGAGGDDTSDTAPRGACAMEQRVGRFSVEAQKDFGVVQGTVLEGIVPTSIPEVVAEAGGCQVLKRRNLVCSPACMGAETCGEGGKCIPYPRQTSVGEVTIAGLTKAVKMVPQMPGATYFAPGADNPPFEPGRRVVLTAKGGGSIDDFQLFGVGSVPLTEAPTWVLEAGKDFTLSWAPPAAGSPTRIAVELTIDQHGMTPLSLACDFEDTGEASIPSRILDQLVTSGVSGFPNGRIARHSVDHVQVDAGCVELNVGSVQAATVRVAGFTPCQQDRDCPDGRSCNTVLERCE